MKTITKKELNALIEKYHRVDVTPWNNGLFKVNCYSRNGRRMEMAYIKKENY